MTTPLEILFLGTGTSVGIPVIGCECRVCHSNDSRNRRWRSSLLVVADGIHIVIDASLDFREQVLRYKFPRVDAVLVTHSHADHIFGLDDMRRFNTLQGGTIPVYASPRTLEDLHRIFSYAFLIPPPGTFRPQLEFQKASESFAVGKITVTPLPVIHGHAETLGFRIDYAGRSLGYVPDCHTMPVETVERFRGVDVMILDALRHKPHSTHLTVEESVAVLAKIGAHRSFLTHMGHDLEHAETQELLPENVELSWDGLSLSW